LSEIQNTVHASLWFISNNEGMKLQLWEMEDFRGKVYWVVLNSDWFLLGTLFVEFSIKMTGCFFLLASEHGKD